MSQTVEELLEVIRKLHDENRDLRNKVEFLTNLTQTLAEKKTPLQDRPYIPRNNGPRYHDPEDRSWRAWPSDDAAD